MKKIFIFLLLVLVMPICFITVGCEDNSKEKLVTAPTQAYIVSNLRNVPGVLDVEAVTEFNDPNNLLNKAGCYYASVYFSYSLVNQNDLNGSTIIEKGPNAGGCVEVFKTKNDANKRNNYLASFDGTFLATGSHSVVGTIVVRTSNILKSSQQNLLESNIIAILTGNLNDVNRNIGTPDFDDNDDDNDDNDNNNDFTNYDELFTFPTIDSAGQNVKYFVYYEPLGKDAEYAKINIKSFTYSYNDEYEDILQIRFTFQCSVVEMYNGDIGFNIILNNGTARMTSEVLGTVSSIGTVTLTTTVNMWQSYAEKGVTISFSDYIDNYYWDDREYNEDYFYDYYTTLINLPNTDNSNIDMKYYCCYEGDLDYTLESHITITDITYSFDDTTLGQLCIIYEFEGYVNKAIENSYYLINANIYDSSDNFIRSVSLIFDGYAGQTVSDNNWLTLYTSEIGEGITIKFENEYWNENDMSEYERLIDIESNASVWYGIFYEPENNYAIYADIDIKYFTYSFDDSQSGKLTISLVLNCYIYSNYADEFIFEVATYNLDDEKINSKYVSGTGNDGDLVKIETQITLDMSDVFNGISIKFENYYQD